MKIRIHRKDKSVPLPELQTRGSAGLDIHAAERCELWPGVVAVVSTGLIIEPPAGYFYRVYIRSSLAIRYGICLANSVGIIDEDYCGPEDELLIGLVRLYNPRDRQLNEPFIIDKGTRFAQLIFERRVLTAVEWEEMPRPDFAGPSRGGVGSTGSK